MNHDNDFLTQRVNDELDQLPSTQAEVLEQHVRILSETERSTLEGRKKAVDYILETLKKDGIAESRIEFQDYGVDGLNRQNIIIHFTAEEGVKDVPKYLIGAHYDTHGQLPGADDNASGVAGLLEIARMLNKIELTDRNIDLIFYDTEELPYFGTKDMGSYIHAESVQDDLDIQMVMVLEMIGYFSGQEGSQEYPIFPMKYVYPDKGNFIAIVSNTSNPFKTRALKEQFQVALSMNDVITVESINAPNFVKGIDFSDHRNYWTFGIPAVMITDTSFYRNKNYHTESDTHETLDYLKMKEVVDATFLSVLSL